MACAWSAACTTARATATAQVMAGIQPAAGDAVIDRLVATEGWKNHKTAMEAQWKSVSTRIGAIEKWREQEVKLKDVAGRTLLYPFSGPDFINAWALYPNHGKYVFFSLENPGLLPNLEKMGPKEFDALLRDVLDGLAHAAGGVEREDDLLAEFVGDQQLRLRLGDLDGVGVGVCDA